MFRLIRKGMKGLSFSVLFIEFISIVMAIFLGFIAANWQEGRQNRKKAKDAMQMILAESKRNQAEVADKLPYYKRVLVEMDSLYQVDGIVDFSLNQLPSWNGMNPPFLQDAAFQLALSRGTLSHFDLETAEAISQLYEIQEAFEQTVDFTTMNILAGNIDSPSGWYEALNFFQQHCQVYSWFYEKMEKVLE